MRTGARGGREREVERGGRGTGVGSLALLAPSEDPCLALPLAAHGGRRLSFPLSLSSVHSRCLPHRTASGPRVRPLFPVRLFRVPFRFWGVVRVLFPPSGGRGAPRVGVPPALSPWLPGARRRTEPASCEGCADGRVVAAAVLPPASSAPRPLSGYLATAFRRVGLKTPGGVASPSPGSGGRRGPSGAVDVRRLPRTPVPRAAGGRSRGVPSRSGFGSPLSGARGARLRAPGSPVRRRSRAPCPSVPTRFPSVVFRSSSRWPARGEPLSVPPPPLSGGGGWRGDRAAVSSRPKGKRSYDS